jgi:hypothetical protein
VCPFGPGIRDALRLLPNGPCNWRVPCSCLCVETPVVACPQALCTAPRSSILCGCIDVLGKQVNAGVWGRCLAACAVYVKRKTNLECIGGSSTKSLPPSQLRNPGVPAVARPFQLPSPGLFKLSGAQVPLGSAGHRVPHWHTFIMPTHPGQSPAYTHLPKRSSVALVFFDQKIWPCKGPPLAEYFFPSPKRT